MPNVTGEGEKAQGTRFINDESHRLGHRHQTYNPFSSANSKRGCVDFRPLHVCPLLFKNTTMITVEAIPESTISTTLNDETTANDAEMARALSEQFRKEAAAAEFIQSEIRAAQAFGASAVPSASGGFSVVYTDDDAARRMEQEASDAELAARLAREEDGGGGVVRSGAAVADGGMARDMHEQELTRGRRNRRLKSFISCIVMAGLVFLIFAFLNKRMTGAPLGDNPFEGIFDPNEWFQGGAWEGGDWNSGAKGKNNAWMSSRTGYSGLKLRVLNNLDDDWQDIFFNVMTEWDNGNPDAVSFNIERISDPNCREVDGALVVCNGNYGRTSWRGINELVMQNGYIVSSVAKLNDYFLEGKPDDLRQYVACHEIG